MKFINNTNLVYDQGLHAGGQVPAHIGDCDPQLPARGVAVPGVPAPLAANLEAVLLIIIALNIFVHWF